MTTDLQLATSKVVYDKMRSSNNQLQRTGFTGPCLSERISPAAELERSKDAISLEGVDKAAFRCRAGVLYEAADSVRD
jgi:hypothetical protein